MSLDNWKERFQTENALTRIILVEWQVVSLVTFTSSSLVIEEEEGNNSLPLPSLILDYFIES